MKSVALSACPLDCPDRCSLDVEVDDGRVLSVRGNRKNPLTDGFICGKVARFDRRVHGPERVMYPAIRVGPKGPGARFERVSWDEALDLVASRWRAIVDESGGEALLPVWYGGSNGYLTGGGLDAALWAHLGTSRAERTLCATNAGAASSAVYPDLPGGDPLDVAHARLVALWGANPHASGVHLVPLIKQVLDGGGEILVVDPRRTPWVSQAKVHLAPRPGTDVVVAMALLRLAFDRGYADQAFLAQHTADADALQAHVAPWTPEAAARVSDVPARDIETFAAHYAAASPAVVRCGWGVERTRNGTDSIRSILSLPAVYGKFGARGGGYAMSTSAGYRFDRSVVSPPHRGRMVNLSQLGRALDEATAPRIRAVYVYDCNPVATVPDQGRLARALASDALFTVVHEQVWNDTTDYADVVLPATTFLEHRELTRSYGGYLLQWAEPAIAPIGESRPNHAVFQALAARMGAPHELVATTEEDLAQRVISGLPTAPPGAWEALQRDRFVKLPSKVQFVDAFPSGPVRFLSPAPPSYRPPPRRRAPPVRADLAVVDARGLVHAVRDARRGRGEGVRVPRGRRFAGPRRRSGRLRRERGGGGPRPPRRR